MTPKQKIVMEYLESNVNFKGLKEAKNNCWLRSKPLSWLYNNGITTRFFNDHIKKAIELAEYKNPESDRTYLTVFEIRNKLIDKYCA